MLIALFLLHLSYFLKSLLIIGIKIQHKYKHQVLKNLLQKVKFLSSITFREIIFTSSVSIIYVNIQG